MYELWIMGKSTSDNKYFNLDDGLCWITIQVYKSQHSKLRNLSRPGLSISSIIRNSIDLYISKLDQNSNSGNKMNFQELSTSSENNNYFKKKFSKYIFSFWTALDSLSIQPSSNQFQ